MKDIRIKKIVEIDSILDTYKGLINDYINLLESNLKIIKYNEKYADLEKSYKYLIKECKKFDDSDYRLNTLLEQACKIYNDLSNSLDILMDHNKDEENQIVLSLVIISSGLFLIKTIFIK